MNISADIHQQPLAACPVCGAGAAVCPAWDWHGASVRCTRSGPLGPLDACVMSTEPEIGNTRYRQTYREAAQVWNEFAEAAKAARS
jgi:hypothetical protein